MNPFPKRNVNFPKRNVNGKQTKNWMYGMGILFIVMATVIALRNFYLYSTHLSVGFYLDNYTNNSVTNEKFVIAMLIGGGILLYWGKFRNARNLNNLDNDTKNFN